MIDVWDVNARALIAFALMMIVGLLIYIAFFKESADKGKSRSSHRSR